MEENQNGNPQDTNNQEFNLPEENLTPEESTEISEENLTKVDSCEELLAEEKDKYLRLYAEFDNFRKRSQKERADIFKYANEETLVSLLPVLDDFDRAIKLWNDEGNTEGLEGVQLIYNKLYNTLKDKGLQKIEINQGDDFNVDTQEAITQVEGPEELKSKVVDVIETGYKLGDKVIRYAKVITGK